MLLISGAPTIFGLDFAVVRLCFLHYIVMSVKPHDFDKGMARNGLRDDTHAEHVQFEPIAIVGMGNRI